MELRLLTRISTVVAIFSKLLLNPDKAQIYAHWLKLCDHRTQTNHIAFAAKEIQLTSPIKDSCCSGGLKAAASKCC